MDFFLDFFRFFFWTKISKRKSRSFYVVKMVKNIQKKIQKKSKNISGRINFLSPLPFFSIFSFPTAFRLTPRKPLQLATYVLVNKIHNLKIFLAPFSFLHFVIVQYTLCRRIIAACVKIRE